MPMIQVVRMKHFTDGEKFTLGENDRILGIETRTPWDVNVWYATYEYSED
jgi:hypothetical protein